MRSTYSWPRNRSFEQAGDVLARLKASGHSIRRAAVTHDVLIALTGRFIVGWGWYYLSTILDDFSRYIIARRLSPTMEALDVKETLDNMKPSACTLRCGWPRMPGFARRSTK